MSVIFWIVAVLAGTTALAFVVAQVNAARAVARAPKLGQVTPVNGGALHWVEEGRRDAPGPTLVCIHGLGGSLRAFTYALTPILAQHHRVISIDRPGSGYSERDGAHLAPLETQGRMVFELLDKLGVERPVLIGHSLGGALSLRMAYDQPDRVGGLVLLAAATRPVEDLPEVFTGLNVHSAALRNFLGETFAGALGPLIVALGGAKMVFAPEPVVAGFDDRGGGILGARPKGYIRASEDLVAATASMEWMNELEATLTAPGVVVYGDEDALLDAQEHGRLFAQRQGFRYIELPGKGHMLPMTQPEACADAVATLLEVAPA